MMQLKKETKYRIVDKANRQIGIVTVERIEDDLVTGRFSPAQDFAVHQALFRQFEEAANAQALPLIDELEERIAASGIYVIDPNNGVPIQINDLQIWSDEGISFRTRFGMTATQHKSAN